MKNLTNKNEVILEGNTLFLKGPLTKETVMGMWEKYKCMVFQGSSLIVHLEQVTHCDSASLAFLLELMRNAQQNKIVISFTNMPKQMIETAKVNGLIAFLPISDH